MTLSTRLKGGAAFALGLAISATAALAGGMYPGYDPSSNTYFQTYAPTGNEFTPMDTQLSAGQNPATIGLMGYQLAGLNTSNFRNALIGGDFTANPFQRGTSQAADITSTLTYGPDRWYLLGGASSAINWSRQSAGPTGQLYSYRFQRKSANANTAEICTGQVLESANSYRFAGQTAILSFWAKSGALFSAAGNNMKVVIGYGTGTDGTSANFDAGTWTGYAAAYSANTAITTTMTRYSVAAAIPSTATQVGIKFCYTPVGTAGATDSFELAGVQLESSGATLPSGSTLTLSQYAQPSTLERRPLSVEYMLATRHFYRLTEGATVTVRAHCTMATTSIANCLMPFPTTMRAVPTVTYVTGWAASASTASSSVTACTGNTNSTQLASTVGSTTAILMNCASSAGFGAAGTAGFLFDNNTATPGQLNATADL